MFEEFRTSRKLLTSPKHYDSSPKHRGGDSNRFEFLATQIDFESTQFDFELTKFDSEIGFELQLHLIPGNQFDCEGNQFVFEENHFGVDGHRISYFLHFPLILHVSMRSK